MVCERADYAEAEGKEAVIDERVLTIDVNLLITVVAAILLVGGVAVLVAKRKGKKR